MGSSRYLTVVAIVLGPVVLLLLALALSTNYWITYTVDRSRLRPLERVLSRSNLSMSHFHNRSRGIFKLCFQSRDIQFLLPHESCINTQYEPPEDLHTPSKEYLLRLHLMRGQLAFLIIGLATFVIGYMVGVVLCCQKRALWAKVAGVFTYTGGFASAVSVAFFHGVEYMERSVIKTHHDGYMFYANWPQSLQEATIRTYNWSYILCWTGAVLAAICGTLYIISAWLIASENKIDDSNDELARSVLSLRQPDFRESYYFDQDYNPHIYPGMPGPYAHDFDDNSYPIYDRWQPSVF